MNELNQRNCIFDVVFFESNSSTWLRYPEVEKFLLLRKMLVEHLKRFIYLVPRDLNDGRPQSKIQEFPDWLSTEWLCYCQTNGPRLAFISQSGEVLCAMVSHFLDSKICSVVRFDSLKFKGNRIMAEIATVSKFRRIDRFRTHPHPSILIKHATRQVVTLSESAKAIATQKKCREFLEALRKKTCSIVVDDKDSLLIFVASLQIFYNRYTNSSEVRSFSMLASLCYSTAQMASLRQRTSLQSFNYLKDKVSSFETVMSFLQKFAKCMRFTVNAATSLFNNTCCYPNLFDELLFLNLLVTIKWRHPKDSLREIFGETCYELANKICELSGLEDNLSCFQPNQLLHGKESFQSGYIKIVLTSPPKPSIFKNDVFQEILAPVLGKAKNNKAERSSTVQQLNTTLFFEELHWHSSRKLESGDAQPNSHKPHLRSKRPATTYVDRARRPKKEISNYSSFLKAIHKVPKLHQKMQIVEDLLNHENASPLMADANLAIRVGLVEVELLEEALVKQLKRNNIKNVYILKIFAYHAVKTLFTNLPEKLRHGKILQILKDCLCRLGFNACADYVMSAVKTFDDGNEVSTGQECEFSFKSALEENGFPDQLSIQSDTEFQMKFCGKYFDRYTNCNPDSRVDFIPDDWQKELLDIVDKNESALVCAPTSSGKTFIAFYLMQKAPTSDNNSDLVVYVSPTKAVVNQVAEEIKRRFPKKKHLFGIYTRDFRQNQFVFRVLICVPQILEILMLSPVLSHKWIPRLKWIIFDEVHSMGEKDNGAVWEHLILMSPCPILALSATVANYNNLFQWMKVSQNRKGFQMHLVPTAGEIRRHCELQKFIYAPCLNENHEADTFGRLIRINPIIGLTTLTNNEFPSNVKLLPDECLKIFAKLKKACAKNCVEAGTSFQSLTPSEFFAGRGFLNRDDAENYETQLKRLISDWTNDSSVSEKSRCSKKDIVTAVSRRMNSRIERHLFGQGTKTFTRGRLSATLPKLLQKLDSLNLLPAICFCSDRNLCEELASEILVYNQRLPFDSICKKRLRKAVCRLNSCMSDESLMNALMCGVGVHHAGLPAVYRLTVEELFRTRALPVVIATGTLACGINAPCRTVVFVEDNIFLDSVNHLQMMGRAGRRGFDLVGHVVYFGLPFQRVKQLLCWPLQPLVASFPMSISMVLRTLCLETQFRKEQSTLERRHTESVELVRSRLIELFSNSFYSNGRAIPELQIRHQTRFAIEFFLRNNLINEECHLLEVAGLVTHLFHTEPANLVFALLISSGTMNQILENHNTLTLDFDVMHFLNIFASIFYRKPYISCHRSRSLPNLPYELARFIEGYNGSILQILTACMKDYSSQCLNLTTDSCLPLSKMDLSKSKFNTESLLFKEENTNTEQPEAYVRSLFSSLSGNKDHFDDAYDFAAHSRAGIFLDEASIPTFTILPTLNAYIVDFAYHGDIKRIEKENGIRSGFVYDYLRDAEVALATISTSLQRLADRNSSYSYVAELASVASAMFRDKMSLYAHLKPNSNLKRNISLQNAGSNRKGIDTPQEQPKHRRKKPKDTHFRRRQNKKFCVQELHRYRNKYQLGKHEEKSEDG